MKMKATQKQGDGVHLESTAELEITMEVEVFALRKPATRSASQHFDAGAFVTLIPPAAARAEFSQRENFHHSGVHSRCTRGDVVGDFRVGEGVPGLILYNHEHGTRN